MADPRKKTEINESQLADLLDEITDADIVVRSQFLLSGRSLLQLIATKIRISQNKGKGTNGNKMFVAEFKVLGSTNREMSPGSVRAWIVNLDKNPDTAMGNVKQMLLALTGTIDGSKVSKEEMKELFKAIMGPDQEAAGLPIYTDAWDKVVPATAGKAEAVYTNHNWKHVKQDEVQAVLEDIAEGKQPEESRVSSVKGAVQADPDDDAEDIPF
jgi:hypothetical protein